MDNTALFLKVYAPPLLVDALFLPACLMGRKSAVDEPVERKPL